MVVQRVIISFAKSEGVKYISHLDLMRLWMRALSRSRIPVCYSEGFSPHPKIALGAPLAVGVTSDCEMLDLQLETRLSREDMLSRLAGVLPSGIRINDGTEVPISSPSLQSRIQFARYRVSVEPEMDVTILELAIAATIKAECLPRTRMRDGKPKSYDLRPLIHTLFLDHSSRDSTILQMTLRQDNTAAGRPQEVVAQLGYTAPPLSINRTELILAD